MMKKLLLVVALAFLASSGLTYGQGINWFSGVYSTNYLCYADGSTYLTGDTDSSVGCFAQLIWVGANGIIDTAQNSGDGVMGDDVVVDYWYVGAGSAGGDDGWFDSAFVSVGDSVISNGYYYARVWSAPSSDYSAGLVPTSATNYYANSTLWQFPQVDEVADQFEINPGTSGQLSTTLSPVPEPAAFGLAIIGLVGLRFFGRKRK